MKSYKTPFAYDENGKIYDYKTAEKGKEYFCNCGGVVKIRGGEIIKNHFYHINEKECSNESAIHKAYKEVFKKVKKIKLPFEINGTDLLKFDRVILEKRIDNFQPDAIGYIKDKKYLIEFAKTSFIGEIKEKKIKDLNLFCLEVKINTNLKTTLDIANHLVNDQYNKNLIHSPTFKELEELKEKYYKIIIEEKTKYLKNREEREIKFNNKIEQLRKANEDLKNKISKFEYIFEKNRIFLHYIKSCKNGAKYYRAKYLDIYAFLNDNGINLVLDE
jgi:competence CoiA-like predicted nuclease